MADATETKREVRRRMRGLRRDLPDQAARSARICGRLQNLVEVSTHRVVMVYDAVPGEPDLRSFVQWCRTEQIVVVSPSPDRDAEHPVHPSEVNMVIVPGLAFTVDGDRLGQGGGWYDRFLQQVGAGCVRVGVCFSEQVVGALPVEPHDVRLDLVVTDAGSTAGNRN